MRGKHNMQFRKKLLTTAITASLGLAASSLPNMAVADIYVWGALSGSASDKTVCSSSPDAATIIFTMLDGAGGAMGNTSITAKGANQYQTPTCGTLTYDTDTNSGSMEIAAFDFFANDPTLPAEAVGITIDKVPAGLDDGSGELILANMLFNWNGTNGIPVSISYNARSLLDEMDGTPNSFSLNSDGSIASASPLLGDGSNGEAVGDAPASDGTYNSSIPVNGGYLQLGPVALATTDFDTTNVASCTVNNCLGVNPSADITASSAVADNSINNNRYDIGTGNYKNLGGDGNGHGIGGYPMQDGPFGGNNANFDITSMTLVSFTDTTPPSLTMNAHVNPAGTSPLTLTVGVDAYVEPGATCTDAAPLNTDLNASVVIGGDTVDTNTVGTYNVTYNCQDPSNNAAPTQTRIVNVVGAGVPSITILGDNPATHECATTYTDAGATANDTEDGDISADIVATPNDGNDLTKGIINETQLGNQTIDYDVQDSNSNSAPTVTRNVNVVDTIAPAIAISVGTTDQVDSSTPENPVTYTAPGATATDACDPTFPQSPGAPSGTVNMEVPDTGPATLSYDLTYSISDASGNSGNAVLTVEVTRSQPVITVVGGGVVLNVGDTYVEPGIDITDAQDGDTSGITTDGTYSGVTVTIDASAVDTSQEGSYTVTYTAIDSDGNNATVATREVAVGIYAPDSNFTMLDSTGNVVGGTNDVAFDWDGSSFNTDEEDTNFGLMTIKSIKPQPFFNFVWDAHHVRIYDNQNGATTRTLSFDTSCSNAEIESGKGSQANPCAGNGPFIKMDIPAGYIGAHMLFDWNTTSNIDVVNVWQPGGVWDRHGATGTKNQLFDGPAGLPPDPATTWKLVSIDIDGDGINGSPMIDGPFQGFNANFNAGPLTKAGPKEPIKKTAPDTQLGSSKFPPLALDPLTLIAGILGMFGLRRFYKKK